MEKTMIVTAQISELDTVLEFVQEKLNEFKLDKKAINKSLLLTEEAYISLLQSAENSTNENPTDRKNQLQVIIKKTLGIITITLYCLGEPYSISTVNSLDEILDNVSSNDSEQMMRNLVISGNKRMIKTKYVHGINKITITATDSSRKNLLFTLLALALGVFVGLLARLVFPLTLQTRINDYILTPINTIFLNALKMIIGPVVFFSIASCISSFTDITELGKIGSKIVLFYLYTTLAAITISMCVFYIFQPGSFGQFTYMASGEITSTSTTLNPLQTLIDIIPTDIFSPFINNDTLQLIFLAILTGIASTSIGKYSESVTHFFKCANDLFLKIATIISNFIPIMVFVSIASLIISADTHSLSSIVSVLGLVIFVDLLLVCFYLVNTKILGKTSPLQFIKKTFPLWLNAFALRSSSAAMPFTMKECDEKLGIDKKIYSFSIPLGATINMDGGTIFFTISTLFLTRVFGIQLSAGDIATLIFTVLILSVGAPGIPGAGIFCAFVLMAQFKIPIEASAIVIPLSTLLDPINTADNVLGDVVGTYSIAKRMHYMKSDSTQQ